MLGTPGRASIESGELVQLVVHDPKLARLTRNEPADFRQASRMRSRFKGCVGE